MATKKALEASLARAKATLKLNPLDPRFDDTDPSTPEPPCKCGCDNRPAPSEATTLGAACNTVALMWSRVDMQNVKWSAQELRVQAWARERVNRAWEVWHSKCNCLCHDGGG